MPESINDGDSKIKPGQAFWINLTAHHIACGFCNASLDILPVGDVLAEAPLAASGYYKVAFLYHPDGQKEFMRVMQKS